MSEGVTSLYGATEPDTPRVVILISGGGSNMTAIADQVSAGMIDAEIAAVICNNPEAAGLQKARDRNIPTDVVDHRQFASREDFDRALMASIDSFEPDLVVLAGFMRILTAEFVNLYEGHMINIHPSLLPKYQGLHTHQRAIDACDTQHGVTVHFVTEVLDDGPNIIQAVVPIFDGDDAATLQKRVQQQEHVIFPIAVKWFVEGRLRMVKNAAELDGNKLPSTGLQLQG